jgi:hypothetical protein
MFTEPIKKINDLKIIFKNKKIIDFENDLNDKNLIFKLKNKFFEKKIIFKQNLIGCGGKYSMIYNSLIF